MVWCTTWISRGSEEFEDRKYRARGALSGLADRTWVYDVALKNLHGGQGER